MDKITPLQDKLKHLLIIFVPIFLSQMSLYAMNFFDTAMSGRVGADDLAGVAIGSSLWVPVYTGLSGILLAITPIAAQLIGAKKQDMVPFSIIQGLYLSIFISIVVIFIGIASLDTILQFMSLTDKVRHIAKEYLVALSFGIVPLFASSVFRSFIDSLGQTRVTMLIIVASLPINILFNYLFIFGSFGFPKLGGIGAGIASAITYWFIFLLSVVIIIKQPPFSHYQIFHRFYRVSLAKWKGILKIGVPIGLSIFFETSIFAAVTLLMSDYDTVTIASHQAALNFASLLYMLPLSISMALTIVVGYEIGAKRSKDAKQYSVIGITLAVCLSLLSAAVIYFYKQPIASLYTDEMTVLTLTQQFLMYAIFFQIFDAIQAPIQGILRGYKDVNAAFIISLISYWVIGLPFGYLLANYTYFHAFGYWIGLISGLAAGAIGLTVRLRIVQKRFVEKGDLA
ncbi:MATE family efflux transporter [Bacillus alveayuensis]|jgi:multidrug resistance protein, MATE family|uniref:Probable multidrug resistance protein NorM n=1 Tax=Aeribacillus alveayuensis TaxID=279215 RepID=A0ABT9VP48_9BACI|nr:MATE family efflux transporter [Bacillus alveayuensis]MDQ0162751.1 MATE family multidrug resistance protein [Bacillus alveayuensis]